MGSRRNRYIKSRTVEEINLFFSTRGAPHYELVVRFEEEKTEHMQSIYETEWGAKQLQMYASISIGSPDDFFSNDVLWGAKANLQRFVGKKVGLKEARSGISYLYLL